jgi:hypothetical protein
MIPAAAPDAGAAGDWDPGGAADGVRSAGAGIDGIDARPVEAV